MKSPTKATLEVILLVMLLCMSGWTGEADRNPAVDSTKGATGSSDTNNLPVNSWTELLGIHSGVATIPAKPGQQFSLTIDHLSSRGGGFDNLRIYINGLGITDPFTGYSTFSVSTHSIGRFRFEALETNGRFRAGGHGVVDIMTRRGDGRLTGFMEALSDNSIGTDFDQNWYTFGLGGAVSGVESVRFSVIGERRYFGDRRPSSKTEEFLPGSPSSLPSNSLEGWNYSSRVDWQVIPRLELGLTADGSTASWLEYRQPYYFDSNHVPFFEDKNRLQSITLRHEPWSTFSFQARLSKFAAERFRGDATVREDLASYRRSFANPLEEGYDLFWHAEMMSDSLAPHPDHFMDDYYRHRTERTQLDVLAEWQYNRVHFLTAGVEYRRYAFRQFHNQMPSNVTGPAPRWVARYGYAIDGTEIDSDSTSLHDVKQPIEWGFFVSDRIRHDNMTLTGSLRLDGYDYREKRFIDPEYPLDAARTGDWDIDSEDLEPTGVHWCFSPALEWEIAMSGRTRLTARLARSHQAQPYSILLSDYEHVMGQIGSGGPWPITWSDIKPVMTTAVEMGISVQPTETINLAVRLFSHRSENELLIYTESAIPFNYAHYDDGNESKALGAEFALDMSPIESLRLRLNYTYTSAKDIGSIGTYRNIAWMNPSAVPTEYMIADQEQRHALKAVANLHFSENQGPTLGSYHLFEHWRLGIVASYVSGKPYTPTNAYNQVALLYNYWAEPRAETNSERQPAITKIDLKLQRPIQIGATTVTPFLIVRNLLDRKNIVYIYSGSGEADNTGYLGTPEGIARVESGQWIDGTGLNFEEKYQLAQRNPLNYGAPRQVMFGLRISF